MGGKKAVRHPEVSISDNRIRSSELGKIENAAPLEAVMRKYRNSPRFRSKLEKIGPALTGQVGLKTEGLQEIMRDGTFKPLAGGSDKQARPGRISLHYPGSNPVLIYIGSYGRLFISGGWGPDTFTPVMTLSTGRARPRKKTRAGKKSGATTD